MSEKSEDEGSKMEDNSNEEEGSEVVQKKRKLAGGKEQKVKKEKKAKVPKQAKKPTEFKKGKWNPEIVLLKEDKYKFNSSDKPFFDCCIRCNNKNLFRAANTANETLLKECLQATKKISILTPFWS
ncbi:MAG: hypothetical protein ACMG6E_09235, partial [Candidatus Roizmanbacteria bacterium]